MGLLTTHAEIETLARGKVRHTQFMKRIARYVDGSLRRDVNDWAQGDVTYPSVALNTSLPVYLADGMLRLCPTQEQDRYLEFGLPYVKSGNKWTQVNFGNRQRVGNVITAANANAVMTLTHGGHFVDLRTELLNGYTPANSQVAFPVGMNGLERNGLVFSADGAPVLTLRPFQMIDLANGDDVRPVTTELVNVGGQWYALATLPSLAGMVRPCLDPTLTLQPDAADSPDTSISDSYPTRNYGTNSALLASSGRALLRWNLATIPATATVTAVAMYYTAGWSFTGRYCTIYELAAANADFPEGTKSNATGVAGDCCWNYKEQTPGAETAWAGSAGCSTVGTDYINTSLGTWTQSGEAQYTEIACALTAACVTSVQNHVAGSWPIIMIKGGDVPLPYSSDTAYPPKLVVDYTLPVGGGARRMFIPDLGYLQHRGA